MAHIGKQNVNARIHLPYTSYYTHLMQVFPLAPSSPYSIAYSFPSSLSIIHAILKILFSRPPTNDRTCLEMEKSIGRESARKQSCRAPFLYARLIRRLTLTRLQPSFFFFGVSLLHKKRTSLQAIQHGVYYFLFKE